MTPITSKQRAKLRGIANGIEVTVQIGKDGLTEGVIKQTDALLEQRELVKVGILSNAGEGAKALIGTLCAALKAHPVQFIGKRMVIYRKSKKPDVEHIIV